MKKTSLIFTIVFTMMFSSSIFSEWKEISKTVNGSTFYLDFERIRKHDGYVYYWFLVDFLKPDEDGDLSSKSYQEGDCKLFRTRDLSFVNHQQSMGRDIGKSYNTKNPEWAYPSPNTLNEIMLKIVCDQ
jgi:hypothetical protein